MAASHRRVVALANPRHSAVTAVSGLPPDDGIAPPRLAMTTARSNHPPLHKGETRARDPGCLSGRRGEGHGELARSSSP